MSFYLTIYLRQSTQLPFNLHALKSQSLVISMSTNSNCLTHSPHITNPAGRDAEAFAIVNDLSQLISEPTRIRDRSGDKANTLDLFLTSNPDIYSNPILDSPLGKSDHCLITLQHNFVSHQDRSSSSQKVFHNSKADWDSLRNFFAAYLWYSGLSNDPSSFATITSAIQLGMDLSTQSSYKSGKKASPKWFTSQCAKAVKHENHRFKQWKLHQTPYSRALFVQARNLCSKTINQGKSSFVKRINNKIYSCQTGSRSFWSLAKVVLQNFCHSSFPPLKNNSDSSSCTPSSKANLFASTFASNSNLDDQDFQPPLYPTSTITMPPIKFSTRKVRKVLVQVNASKSSGPDGIPVIILKSCAPELAPVLNKLFQISYNLGIFPSSWELTHIFPIHKKVTNLTLKLSPYCNHFSYL